MRPLFPTSWKGRIWRNGTTCHPNTQNKSDEQEECRKYTPKPRKYWEWQKWVLRILKERPYSSKAKLKKANLCSIKFVSVWDTKTTINTDLGDLLHLSLLFASPLNQLNPPKTGSSRNQITGWLLHWFFINFQEDFSKFPPRIYYQHLSTNYIYIYQ